VFKGIHLTLMIGPAVPVAVSKDVIDALDSVKVTSSATGTSGFELTFKIGVKSALQTLFLIGGGVSIPLVRVVVAVTVNGRTDVLIDGVMTNHEVGTDQQNGYTTLTIIGEDLTRVMDYVDFSGFPFPAMPAEAQVALILLKYAAFGVIPMVIPSVLIDVPMPFDRIPHQTGTDLEHVRALAEQVGYVFYMEPGPAVGSSIAYWGPQIKVGEAQPALAVDADASTNVDSLSFSFDNEQKRMPVLMIQPSFSKVPIPIPVPDVTPLDPPLGLVPPIPKHFEMIDGSAKLSAVRAALIALAKVSQSADAVSASGTLDVMRYGRVLKPRKLVGVRGAGTAFDGLWYVRSVTHELKRGEYKQSFSLARNGLVSTVPAVPA
jgi:hypothetical protein